MRPVFESTRSLAGSGFGIIVALLLALLVHGRTAVISLVVLAVLFLVWWAISTFYVTRRRLLRGRLRDVSQRLFTLYGRYQAGQSAALAAAWHAGTQPPISTGAELLATYDQDLSTQALALFDAAAERGLVQGGDRHWLEDPTNPLGVRRVAQLLGVAAERL